MITMHHRQFKHLTITEVSITSNYKYPIFFFGQTTEITSSPGKGSLTELYILEAVSGTGKLVEKSKPPSSEQSNDSILSIQSTVEPSQRK